MLKACSRCGRIHDINESCYKNDKQYKPRNKKIAQFRNTRTWMNKAKEIKERDHYLCQLCLSHKKLTYDNLSVHHIVPLHEDMSKGLDNDNLITLCWECHKLCESGKVSRAEQLSLVKKEE